MGIPFVTEPEVVYGAVEQVTPLIRRVMADNPSHFTYRGTGTYLIGSGSSVAVIDPGPRDDAHVAAILAATEAETITHQLITHTHGDHSPAAAPLGAVTGAPTYGFGPHPPGARAEGDADDDPAGDDPAHDLADDATPEEREAAAAKRRAEAPDTDFVPDVTVGHGDRIEGVGWTIECLHTPGHISNHLCFALAEERALFSGDHVMGWSTTVIPPPDGSMRDYLASLELVRDRTDFDVYYPTHGPPIADPQTHVNALIDHRLDRERQIVEQLRLGVDSVAAIVEVLYVDVRTELHKPAARSVLAHLDKLIADGDVAVTGATDDAPARYSLLD